jgi:hypothetical protein
MQQNAGDASITSSPEHGAWGREMEKLRGAYGHPPTEWSSVPSTDILKIPCESGCSGHSLELRETRGKVEKVTSEGCVLEVITRYFSLMSPAIWVEEDE